MADEQAFVQAIVADPADDALSLIYADWLEERGDPRGELIRVWIDLASIPYEEGQFQRIRNLVERFSLLAREADPNWLRMLGDARAWIDKQMAVKLVRAHLRYYQGRKEDCQWIADRSQEEIDEGWIIGYWRHDPRRRDKRPLHPSHLFVDKLDGRVHNIGSPGIKPLLMRLRCDQAARTEKGEMQDRKKGRESI